MKIFLRRIFVLASLFGIIIFIKNFSLQSKIIYDSQSLLSIGFLILSAYTLGEIFHQIKLPRLIAYFLVGLIFGSNSEWLIGFNTLMVADKKVASNLDFINNAALAMIFLAVGMTFSYLELKNTWKSIITIISIQFFITIIFVGISVYLLFSYFFPVYSNFELIISALLIGILSFETSVELTFTLNKESGLKNRFTDIIFNSVFLKGIIIAALFTLVLAVFSPKLSSSAPDNYLLQNVLLQFTLSAILGILFALSIMVYEKLIGKETSLAILFLLFLISQISALFNLQIPTIFITAGIVIRNYLPNYKTINNLIEKILLLVFVFFFAFMGVTIKINYIIGSLTLGFTIFAIRLLSIFISQKISSKYINEENYILERNWIGFISQGIFSIGIIFWAANKFPGIGNEIKNAAFTSVAFNFIIGAIFYKGTLNYVLSLIKSEQSENTKNETTTKQKHEKLFNAKFVEPDFQDEKLNKSLFNILFKLNDIVDNFNKNFIQQRSEESIELIISATESYSDDYIKIKSQLSKQGLKASEIPVILLDIKENLTKWYLELISERNKIEKNILKLEPLIKDLFISLTDLTDGLQKKFVVELEKEWINFIPNEKLRARFFKIKNRIKFFTIKYFNNNYKLQRVIEYRNLAKYYLIGQSSKEILETVNLVGAERLNTLRQICRLFQDYSNYLDELIVLSYQEKKNKELPQLILSKLDKIHKMLANEIKIYNHEISNTTEELSSRLVYSLASPFNKFLDEIRIAGTYESKAGSLKYSKIFSQSETAKDFTMDTIRFWLNYYIGYLGLFKKDTYIRNIKAKLGKIVQEYLIIVLEEINQNLVDVFREINIIQENIGHKIEAAIATGGNIVELIETEKDQVILPVINKYISNLNYIRSERNIKNLTELISADFVKIAKELPEYIELLEENDFKFVERRPSFIGLRKAKVREIASVYLEHKLPREIGEINELILNHLNVSLEELKNLISMVNFHSQSIVQSENESKGNEILIELAYSLIDKIDHRVNQLYQQIDRLSKNINKKILEKINSSVAEIEKLLVESSITKSSIQIEAELRKKGIISLSQVIWENIKKCSITFVTQSKRIFNLFISDKLKQFLIDFNIKSQGKYSEPDSLSLNEEKLKGLPFIYRKLFDGSPLESNDFFIKSNVLSVKINQQLNNFRDNKNSATLIIGEPGSGKKTLINSIKNSFLSDTNLYHIQITETLTTKTQILNLISKSVGFTKQIKLDELIITLNDKANKRIIIVETLSKLYFRNVDGYNAIKTFFYLVSATNNNVFWLCTIGKLPYIFLNNNFEFGKFFSEKIWVNELHKQELKQILLSRHNATGYDLKYLPDDFTELKNKFVRKRNKTEDQKLLADEYFRRLEDYSAGNIISAMFYWLQSIQKVEENKIIIKPPRKISLVPFQGLSDIYLLTLSQILFHGSLTDQEHQKLFGFSLEESKEILNYLESLNVIYKDSIDYLNNRYFINKFVYKIVEDELSRRNII